MNRLRDLLRPRLASVIALLLAGNLVVVTNAEASPRRNTAIVRAVAESSPSVVNIHGHKTVQGEADQFAQNSGPRRVNGMGTGVVVDPRGYIITNYHVVEGVRRIKVNLSDGTSYIARLINHDPATDLAVIKIPAKRQMPLIKVGSSKDLMTGEPVIAVGNAYGYEHTVTRGIISALHRTVQVSDDQYYYDLIQTDASINPGNSGGPLLNVDGDMIGINVAVRVGAQGIGFAIAVDKAMEVAARLLSADGVGGISHGIVTEPTDKGAYVRRVRPGSAAARAGVQPGTIVTKVNGIATKRALDIERALLGMQAGQAVDVVVQRSGQTESKRLVLGNTAQHAQPKVALEDRVWDGFGLKLQQIPKEQFRGYNTRFHGGLRVTSVRSEGPAYRKGIRSGDVLVGMHIWETVSLDNLSYVLTQTKPGSDPIKFYILRGEKTLFGHLPTTMLR